MATKPAVKASHKGKAPLKSSKPAVKTAAKISKTKPAAKASSKVKGKGKAPLKPSKPAAKISKTKTETKRVEIKKKAVPGKIVIKATAAKKVTPVLKPAPKKKPEKPNPALAKKAPAKKTARDSKATAPSGTRIFAQQFVSKPKVNKDIKLTPFLQKQRKRLLDLKDVLLDSMSGVARGNLHAGSDASAFGMHQADAGSDAYDRDFALSMLSKEQGSLYEIDEALKRIEDGSYGLCEISQKPIPQARLEALPFTRYTVDCQAELEKLHHRHNNVRPHINSLFGLTEEEEEEAEEEEANES